MKLKLIYLCTLIFGIAFTACKKDEPPVKPQAAHSMTAKVDGTDWVAAWPVATNDLGDFTLMGASMNGQSIGMYAEQANITQPGTYTVKAVYAEIPKDSMFGPTWGTPTGIMTITKLDLGAKKVSGTFSFTGAAEPASGASGTRTITSGAFTDINLQ
jgi:hypothetical protein